VLRGWGKLVYYFTWGMAWLIGRLMFKFQVEGRERIPENGALLIASNHVSHLDPPLVAIAFRRPVFHMAKRELFSVPLLLWYMRTIKTILVDRGRGRQALDDAKHYLQAGEAVMIFPEGTRSKTGRLCQGRSGAVVIAIQAGCPILPVAIMGSEKAMTKGSKKIKPVPVKVVIGEPYQIAFDDKPDRIPKEVIVRETVALMERIEALLPEEMRPSAEDKASWTSALAPSTEE
jgi:1-acyl-sn-glycerol-3-phosphate acyltransferase